MISRYWHTLRHLRPVQFYGRLWFRMARPRPDLAPAPGLRTASGAWQIPIERQPSMTGPRQLRFLGRQEDLDAIGWDGPGADKLWRYNQHYFDDLNAAGNGARRAWHQALLADWVRSNPPASGNGWEPYPVSLRIVNWVKWALAGNDLPADLQHSLAVQARWLTRRLEIHLLGNHLFANAKALIFAGCYFDGPEAAGWLKLGFDILRKQVPEQILGDGGHFELTTMYHALAVEDMLDLCNVTTVHAGALSPRDRELADGWRARVPQMVAWLRSMCHPDGDIAFFNDAAIGIAPSLGQLDSYGRRLGIDTDSGPSASVWLADSGYVRLENPRAVALMDLAAVGPDYLPGHAHADTLSVELSVDGQRILVNSGTSRYGADAERLRQRGTAAHNTVVIDGQDSSEVWGGFRVARRARILRADVDLASAQQSARGSHDGYTRLPDRPIHERLLTLGETGCAVEDRVSDSSSDAVARFHFHPALEVRQDMPGAGIVSWGDGRRVSWTVDCGTAWIEETHWHPHFGEAIPNVCLCVRLEQGKSLVMWDWD